MFIYVTSAEDRPVGLWEASMASPGAVGDIATDSEG